MRKLACLGILIILGMRGFAQDTGAPTITHYLFDTFERGKAYLKDGTVQEVDLNYNTLTAEMVFDKGGGQYLAMAEPEKVDSVVIMSRVFIPGDKKFYELLCRCTSPLLEEHGSTIREEGTNVGYGMTSNTTASHSLRSLIQSGGAYQLKLPDGLQIIPKNEFWIFSGGQYHPAGSVRQLNNIFPAKKDIIKAWVKEHHTNFSNNDDMIALVQAIDKN
jgi:hypothetical protein